MTKQTNKSDVTDSDAESIRESMSKVTLDRRQGVRNVNGNGALYEKLLHQFIVDHRHDPDAARHALADRNFKKAGIIIHTLKGVAGTIGATRTRDLAARLDRQIESQQLPDPDFLIDLDDAITQVIEAIEGDGSTEIKSDAEPRRTIDQKHTILIVDDDRISIQAIAASLQDDYNIMEATGYDETITAVHGEHAPDLILLDVMMPDIDGFEICRRLKSDPVSRDIPIIFLTARDQDRDETRGLQAGAVDYIGKPVVPAIVRARVQTQVELRRHVNELQEAYSTIEIQRDRMEEELRVAQQLQRSLLPNFSDTNDEVTVHASMVPAREMSGDFYDVFYADRDHLCLCIGDVTGKGVPAALFMGISKALVRAKAEYSRSTADIVTGVNAEIMKSNDACMFVTLFVSIIEIKTGHMIYTNAGHNPPWLKGSDGSLGKINARHGPPVGTGDREYGETVLSLSRDDLLLLYTDGVTEARNDKNELFGEANLAHLLQASTVDCPESAVQSTMNTVKKFVGCAPRADDLTLIALKYNIHPNRKPYCRYESTLSEYDIRSQTISDLVHQFLEPVQIDNVFRNVLELIMDELVRNILEHGFPDGGKPKITIVLEHAVDHLRLHLMDNGVSFNPAIAPPPDTALPLEERKAGGLGIHLCRSLVDEMYYERKHLRNHLTVVKRLDEPA